MTPRGRQRKWFHRALLALIWLLPALLLCANFRWQSQQDTLQVLIPTPDLPTPNAYDFYVEAGAGLSLHAVTGAYAAVNRRQCLYAPEDAGRDPRPTRAELQRELAQHAPRLALLRQGFRYRYYEPPARSITHFFPHYAKHRALARLLAVEGVLRAEQGDYAGAMHSYLDTIQMGEEIPRGGLTLGMLAGAACQGMGRRFCWETVDHLTATRARDAANRLDAILARHVSFADIMQEEKWYTQAVVLELFGQKDWQEQLIAATGETSQHANKLASSFVNKRESMEQVTRYLDQLIANARQPYLTHGKQQPPLPNHLVSCLLGLDYTEARFIEEKDLALNRLLLVTFALRAYRLEHGRYPDTLASLVPSYLQAVPDDPFALYQPLTYRRTHTGYLLYSIGPDGRDNAGMPSADGKVRLRTAGRKSALLAHSPGDMVAGVNIR